MSIKDILRDSYTKHKPIRLNLDNINQLITEDIFVIAYLLEVKKVDIIFDDCLDSLVYINRNAMVFDKEIEDISNISLIYIMYYSRFYKEKFVVYHNSEDENFYDIRKRNEYYKYNNKYSMSNNFMWLGKKMDLLQLELIKIIMNNLDLTYEDIREYNMRWYLELDRPKEQDVTRQIPIKSARNV